MPALEASRLNLNDALKEGKGAEGQSTRSRRLRGALVVAEVALALILLASAGLLVKSFGQLQKIDRAFQSDNLLTMVVRLPEAKYKDDQQLVSFFRRATERIRALPGVKSVGMVNYLPLYGGLGAQTGYTVEGRPEPAPGQEPPTHVRVTDANYFSTMQIPLLRGRNFTEQEVSEARHVVLISESLARQHFPGEDPIGKRITVPMSDKPAPTEIIGIVGATSDTKVWWTTGADHLLPSPGTDLSVHDPRDSDDWRTNAIARRSSGTARDRSGSTCFRSAHYEQVMADTVSRARFNTLLLALFAALATILAAVGIFGVMNYSLTLRTREIGLRMALGAQRSGVLLLILKQGLMLTLIGAAIGLVGALALTRLMTSMLFEVNAADPVTFGAIVLLLMIVSLIACYLPARRATRIDPMIALRSE